MTTFAALDPLLASVSRRWKITEFRRAFTLVESFRGKDNSCPVLSLSSAGAVQARDGEGRQPPSADYLERYNRVLPGQLVVNPLWLIGGAIGVSQLSGCVSPEYRVYQPATAVHPRYMHYLLRSQPYFDQYRLLVRAETTFDRRISKNDFHPLPLIIPPVRTPQAIADFLDTETSRIDALITKKRRMIVTLDDWEQRAALDAVGDFRECSTRTMRQFGAEVLTGPFGTVLAASEYIEGGVPLINPTHIRRGELVPESHVSVPQDVADRIGRHKLAAGDVVMGRKGDVGRCAVVPPAAAGWLCGSDSIAIRCMPTTLLPDLVAAVLQVDLFRQQLHRGSTGATLANVNESTLLGLELPDLNREEQSSAVREFKRVMRRRNALVARLVRQVELLQEHRQALITAAVTGELDVPGVAA